MTESLPRKRKTFCCFIIYHFSMINRKYVLPIFAGALALISACSEKNLDLTTDPGSGIYENVAPASAVRGHVRIKFAEDPTATKAGNAVDLSSLGSYTMVRSFPDAGRFEERHRKYGLHLWYDVFFDESLPLTRTANELSDIEGVDIVDFVQPVRPTAIFPFNDPDFSKQWHYYNPGTATGAVAGSDVNLLPAWEVTTGRPDVIVAISDGGLQWDHPDLAANMWINEAELNGQPGVDDDGNGYVDDVYGFNFVVDSGGQNMLGTIVPGDHGTHVGGTVAAVNNNGVGLCGIAGGDGTSDSGVRLMSTQTSGGSAYIGDAFVYAADNGAVLVNCSWSIDSPSAYISQAIDYFNDNAGIDENGAQTGPMAGGLVIFAAGNDNRSTQAYPAMDDNVFSVAAIGADYQRAYYSNYGDWVDITAPGGDANKGFNVLSTLPNGSYGSMQGTSMACPHVTGVAALVVSRFGGAGFTRQNLIDILRASANRKIYDYNSSSFAGMLGAGLVDAGAAVSVSMDQSAPVTDFGGSASGNVVTLKWTVPESENLPERFAIWYDTTPFSSPTADTKTISVSRGENVAGSTMEYRIDGLEFNTEYYFLIASVNIFGQFSDYVSLAVNTVANSVPVVTPLDGTSLTLKSFETGTLSFSAEDADGHSLSCSLSSGLPGASASIAEGVVSIKIDALKAEDGKTYSGILYVTDGYDSVETPFSYTVLKNNPPTVSRGLDNIVFGAYGETSSLNLSEYFSDPDGESLEYSVKVLSGGTSTVSTRLNGETLVVTAKSYGTATLQASATDARGESTTQTFSVLVRDGSVPVDLYPNPVKDNLYVRTATVQTADITVSNRAGAVVLSTVGGTLDPFAPLALDMKDLPGGVYYVTIKSGELDATYSVAKQ